MQGRISEAIHAAAQHPACQARAGAKRPLPGRRSGERWARYNDNITRLLPGMVRRHQPTIDGRGWRELRLLIVDPRSLTRGCLVAAMRGAPGIGAITAVAGIKEALEHVEAGMDFDAVLASVSGDAIDAAPLAELSLSFRMALRDAAIIILSASIESAHILSAFRQGARGYLTTDTPVPAMVDAIRLIAVGWAIHPPVDLDMYLRAAPTSDGMAALTARLTPRQSEVLRYLVTGMPNKNIAFQLGLSERTVKAHVQEIMQRIGAANRTQIVALLGGRGPGGAG